MKLQLALDGDLQSSMAVLAATAACIGIAEIGTPLIYREGVRAIRELRNVFPQMALLADLKIMDAGDEEASIAFDAGADLVTVLGVTNDATIQGTVAAAQRAGKQVMVDMMQVTDPVTRGRDLLKMGCDYLCIHTAHDMQSAGHSPLGMLAHLRQELPEAKLAAAGGINLNTIDAVAAFHPEIIVIGGAITRASDPGSTANALYERINHTVLP